MNCDHEHHLLVHDASSGDKICTGCGIVLESFAFEEPRYYYEERPDIVKPPDTLQHLGRTLNLPDSIIATASVILSHTGIRTRQSTIIPFSASALYFACKIEGADRAEVEIISNCGVTTKQLAVSNKIFRRALSTSPWASKIYAPANPIRLIPRFLDVLCSEPAIVHRQDKCRIRHLSEDIGVRIEETGVLQGKSPECCCIVCIYTALCELGYPATLIGDVCLRCGLTPNTIENAMSILRAV